VAILIFRIRQVKARTAEQGRRKQQELVDNRA
jgi:hypothetical protein